MDSGVPVNDPPALPKTLAVNEVYRSGTPSPDSIKNSNTIQQDLTTMAAATPAPASSSPPATVFDDDDGEPLSDAPSSEEGSDGDDEKDGDFDPVASKAIGSDGRKLKGTERQAALAQPDSDGEDEDEVMATGGDDDEEATPPRSASKSKKGKSHKAKGKTPRKVTPSKRTSSAVEEEEDEENGAPVPRSSVKKPKRNSAVGLPGNRPLPATYEDCEDFDKMLIDMRDSGMNWEPIRKRWARLTGEVTGHSTLPNRYSRIKAHFINIPDEDTARLLKAKQDIEVAIDENKWKLIAKQIVRLQGGEYKPSILRRHYQNIMNAREIAPPQGVHDEDFAFKREPDEEQDRIAAMNAEGTEATALMEAAQDADGAGSAEDAQGLLAIEGGQSVDDTLLASGISVAEGIQVDGDGTA